MEKVFEIYIKTTPERLWEAITDAADSRGRTDDTFGAPPPARERERRGERPAAQAGRKDASRCGARR